jgi:hypothetical protein
MKIFLNFTNPILISSGSSFDIIKTQVINGSNFTSADGKISLME